MVKTKAEPAAGLFHSSRNQANDAAARIAPSLAGRGASHGPAPAAGGPGPGGSRAAPATAEPPPKESPAPPRATASENTPSARPATSKAIRHARAMRQSWQHSVTATIGEGPTPAPK